MSAQRLAQEPGSVRAISPQQPHDDRSVSAWCPRNVRKRGDLITASAVCPCPRTIRVHDLSAIMSVSSPSPWIVRDHVQSMSAHNPCPKSFRRQSRVATYWRPRDFRPASALAPLDADMHSFVPTQGRWSRSADGRLGARIQIRLYVAGRRVNVLLARLPSALHIDPPPGSRAFAFRISRGENCWRQD